FTRGVYPSNDSIWLMNSDGSGQAPVTSGPGDLSPDWSPNGEKIVFGHNGAIYTIGADGTGLTAVTSGVEDEKPKWSPDGTKIVFVRYVPNPSGGSVAHV